MIESRGRPSIASVTFARLGVVLVVLASACDSTTDPGTAPAPSAGEHASAPAGASATTMAPTTASPPAAFRATAIAAGGQTSYALMSDGTIRGWGNSRSFALGHTDIDLVASPITVAGIDHAVAIAAGGERRAKACVIRDDASVICWGHRDGFPMTLDKDVAGMPPTEIPALAGAREITLGEAHGCARMGDDTLQCWRRTDEAEPRAVPELTDIVAVRSASLHTCALKKAGDVWCWGLNRSGAVATLDAPGASLSTPTRAEELPAALELGLADGMSCSRHADDTVRCWGSGPLRQLELDRKPITFARSGTSGHLCVVVEGGGVRCVGARGNLVLGIEASTVADAKTLVAVPGLPVVTAAATAPAHTCALAENGQVWCWGGNEFGQLGDGTATDRATPVQVGHLLDRELVPPAQVAAVDLAPVERFDELPQGCRAGALTLSSSELPPTRFDTKYASARVERETIWVHLRNHGFDAKAFDHDRPRGSGLHLELVLSRQRITERRIRNPEPWEEGETEVSSRKLPVTTGTYVTAAAWFAMGTPREQREVDIRLAASDGPILLEAALMRAGDVQQVELSRIGPDWVCGTITFKGPRGELQGDFAARVRM